jgi:hypothetical protein
MMGAVEIPNPVVACDGCEKDLNTLNPYLMVTVKAQREVLVSNEVSSDDPNEVGNAEIFLGTKSGRGVLKKFHDFDCARKWFDARKGLAAKLEYHHEDEVYVPEDNRSPEELVEDGELPKEFLTLQKALATAEDKAKGGSE